MRPKVLLTVLLILLAGLALIWLSRPTQQPPNARLNTPGFEPRFSGEQEAVPPQETSADHVVSGMNPKTNTNAHNVTSNSLSIENSLFYEDWKRPIAFYGKVVDASGNPVPKANVSFSWTDTSSEGHSQTDKQTDTNGLFSLSGVNGRMLSVNVSKSGYYTSRRERSYFDYSPNFAVDYHQPDPSNPVLFHLQKKASGVKLITSRYGVSPDLEISGVWDGSPVWVDFFQRKSGGSGQMELCALKPKRGETASEWWFQMSIPDGGFVEHNDEFPFEAPEAGYQSKVEFNFKAGTSNWTETLGKDYYIVFGQPRKYGRIHLETGMYWGVRLQYAINPTGSRDLEPMEPQPIRRELPPGVTEVVPDDVK